MIRAQPRCYTEQFASSAMCDRGVICAVAGFCVPDCGYDPYNSADSLGMCILRRLRSPGSMPEISAQFARSKRFADLYSVQKTLDVLRLRKYLLNKAFGKFVVSK